MSRAPNPSLPNTSTEARLAYELKTILLLKKAPVLVTDLLAELKTVIYPATTSLETMETLLRETMFCQFSLTESGKYVYPIKEKSKWKTQQELVSEACDEILAANKAEREKEKSDTVIDFMDEF